MTGPVFGWRIAADAPSYEADDRAGKGAEISGGRWNREGTPLLYVSSSRALACLETLVHLARDPLPFNRYLVEFTFPTDLWKARDRFDPDAHVGWDAEPPGQVSLDWGTAWALAKNAVIAEVPSVIVPEESNHLVNPLAAGMERVGVRKVRRWLYDHRFRPAQRLR